MIESVERPKTLTIDIETSPNVAHVWSLWKQTVSLSQLQEHGQVISFAAKWHGKPAVEFRSDFHDGHDAMIQRAHELLDEAEIVVHFNGTSFDIPHLRRQFLLAGLTPPSPFKEVDLKVLASKRFRFVSNKLDNISRELGLAGKTSHTGHKLWVDCMAGDAKAWALMKRYNMQDVRLTEDLYDKLLPWIGNHPSLGLYAGGKVEACSRCGSTQLQRRGMAYTALGSYQRFQCQGCGSWHRGGKRQESVDVRGIA